MADEDSEPVRRTVHFDADASVREEARASRGGPVRGPGQAAPQAAGDRRPRPAADVAGEDVGARHNWIPRGPRNVGGRVRCIAIDPTNPLVIYAGPASGGVYKSVDGAETWFPLWHDEPSLSMAAISVCPANTAGGVGGDGRGVDGRRRVHRRQRRAAQRQRRRHVDRCQPHPRRQPGQPGRPA